MAALNAFSNVLGQEQVKSALQKTLEQNRLPHALLFYGPKGTGKFPAALDLARLLLCEKKTGCGVCPGCKMVAALSHPDLSITIPLPSPGDSADKKKEEARSAIYSEFILAKRENPYHPVWKENKDFIPVPDVQNLQGWLSRKPLEADWLVAILVDADHLKFPEAQNKLLKTLEEPHANRLIILLAERPKNLLPTILSRTQRFFFPALPGARVADFAQKTFGLSKVEAEQQARFASGSISNLYFLQAAEERERRAKAWETLKLALAGKEALLFQTLKQVAETKQKEEVLSFLAWLEIFVWELFCLFELKRPGRVNSLDLQPEFEKAASARPFPFLFALQAIGKTRQDLERNVSFRLALFWLFVRILKAKTSPAVS